MPDEPSASSEAADEFLTVAEIAKLLKLNQQTVRNMIDRGELGSVRVGARRVRVRQSQLDAFLAGGERPARAVPRSVDDAAARWQAVKNALEAGIQAVNAEDQDVLDSAIAEAVEAREALGADGPGRQE